MNPDTTNISVSSLDMSGILNETLLNIAFPELMRDFSISPFTVQWLTTAYLLVVGILVPITALLQQWFTTRQMFLGAMTFFWWERSFVQ